MAEQGTLRGELERGWKRFWSLPWKWKGPVLAVLGLVVIGVIGSAGEDEEPTRAAVAQESPAAEATKSVTETPKATSTPKPTETPKPTNTPKPTPTSSPTPAPPEWIKGLTAVDVTGNLKDRGFSCRGPNQLQTLVDWICENAAGDISVSVLGKDATRIRSIDATVFSFSGTPSDARAADFLGFLATVPYDDASPVEARAWVGAHVAEPAETTFGSARFTTYGPPAARTLEIVAVGAK